MVGNNGLFRPMGSITRAEVATVLGRILGRVSVGNTLTEVYAAANIEEIRQFPDVTGNEWFSEPVVAGTNDFIFTVPTYY